MVWTRFKFDGRAVSPVVATLLLIVIAVVASVIVWTWVSGLVSQQPSQVIVEKVIYISGDLVGVTIRNIGSTTVRIGDVGIKVGGVNWDSEDNDDVLSGPGYVDLAPGRVLIVEVNKDGGTPDVRVGDRVVVTVFDDAGNKIFIADLTVV